MCVCVCVCVCVLMYVSMYLCACAWVCVPASATLCIFTKKSQVESKGVNGHVSSPEGPTNSCDTLADLFMKERSVTSYTHTHTHTHHHHHHHHTCAHKERPAVWARPVGASLMSFIPIPNSFSFSRLYQGFHLVFTIFSFALVLIFFFPTISFPYLLKRFPICFFSLLSTKLGAFFCMKSWNESFFFYHFHDSFSFLFLLTQRLYWYILLSSSENKTSPQPPPTTPQQPPQQTKNKNKTKTVTRFYASPIQPRI